MPLMKTYRTEVQTAKDNIVDLAIKPEEQALLQDTLRQVLAFMDNCLKNGGYTYQDVEAYARGVEPNLEKSLPVASSNQVGHWFQVLTEWKKLLGDDWNHTYALANSIYVARQNNILFSVLVQFFGEQAINDRVLCWKRRIFKPRRNS
jgi:hypothetical protein